MTPDLLIEGERRRAALAERAAAQVGGSGGRSAGFARPLRNGEPDFAHGVALYVEGVTVAFDGFKALDDLSLTIDSGELRCIIGPNGAGKTTLMDCITGKTRPDSGRLHFGSSIDLLRLDEAGIATAGIGRKFQKPTVYEALSVLDNLELALRADRRVGASLRWKPGAADRDRIDELLATMRLQPQAGRPAGLLSHGQKQWLEIGMLLAQEPRLLLLDEPVAGMSDEETERTAELFLSLAGQHSLVVVEHDMGFVAALTQGRRKVSVLHEGRLLAEGPLAQVQEDPRVIEVYLGR